MGLKKLCFNKIFWSAISASFVFTTIMFGIAMEAIGDNFDIGMDAIGSNSEEIQIIHEDIKKILSDTHYIKGLLDKEK